MIEKWDLYDINRQSLNRTGERSGQAKEGIYHLSVQVIIINDDDQMLIQKRTAAKKYFAGLWDVSCNGAARAGETSFMAAKRELFEELGIEYDFNERPNFTTNFSSGFCDVFLIRKNLSLSALRLQKEEVDAACFADKETIHKMIDEGSFIDYYHEYIDLCFAMIGHYGAYRNLV